MAKMKISGAKPSQPPAPMVCKASKCGMLIKAALIKPDPSKNNPDYAPWRFLALCNLPQDFSLPGRRCFGFRHEPGTSGYDFARDCSPGKSWDLFPSAIE